MDKAKSQYSLRLNLSSLVKSRLLQESTSVVYLDNVSISRKVTRSTQLDIFLTVVLGESPLERFQNLLASGKLELSTTNGFNHVGFVSVLGAHRKEDLSNIDTSRDTDRLSVRVTHTTRQSISAGTTQHFVRAEHMVGVGTDTNVEGFLSNIFGQVLVNGNTASFQSFRRDLLFLVAHKVGNKGKEIDRGTLGTRVKNTNFRFRDTTALNNE